MDSQKVRFAPFLSFPRKRETRDSKRLWTPAFAGVTVFRLFTRLSLFGFRKETFRDPKTYFRQIWAVAGENEFKVSGRLRLKGSIAINVPDFVEVALIDKEGKDTARQKVSYYPRILTGRRKRHEARFNARFKEVPPPGAIIRLSNID